MIYPSDIEQRLGFDAIKNLLKEECLSALGAGYIEKIRFSNNYEHIDRLLNQTKEFKQILERELLFPSQNYIDVSKYLNKLKVDGLFLEPSEFFEIKLSLNTIKKCLDFFDDNTSFPNLHQLAEQVTIEPQLIRKLNDIIDDKGLVRDTASEELRLIRKSIIEQESGIRRELDRILKQLIKDGNAPDDASLTIRNGRMVIPVLAESKRKVKGFIHGESGTGQTVFLEPTQVLDINNELQDLRNREKREIVRILTEFSRFLGFYLLDLNKAYHFLGLIDFIRAKSKLAIKLHAHKPLLHKETILELHVARHPLLYLNNAKNNKPVIPLHLKLDMHQRMLIISGPNAGGKSVCLKTVGLLQYMLQCGMLVPCDDHSKMGLFNDLMLDIGDEQSLENDLSTYSSHLTNMKNFLHHASKKSLLLIDEFGGGTEPNYGASIAEAILQKLSDAKAFGIITTHFSNLKTMAQEKSGLVNGAMAFDVEKLEPLFRLEIGNPGSSFALELASKIGLSIEVIDLAKAKLGQEQLSLDELLRKLENEKAKFFNKNQYVAALEKKYQAQADKYNRMIEDFEKNKSKLMQEAKLKAKTLFADVNKKIENSIREIKEWGADKVKSKEIREQLKNLEQELTVVEVESTIEVPDIDEELLSTEPLKLGDWIKLKDNGAIGKIINIKGKDVDITIGTLQSKVKMERLLRASRREYRELMHEENKGGKSKSFNISEKFSEFSSSVDYRGMRGEDAKADLVNFLDNALLFGMNQLRIVHGKGDGILRRLIRDYLAECSFVKSFADEHADRGGAGVTIVEL
jgi:DNA mismatch repair protein MutS2